MVQTAARIRLFEHGGFTYTQQRPLVLLRMVCGVKVGVVVEENSTFAKDQGENE